MAFILGQSSNLYYYIGPNVIGLLLGSYPNDTSITYFLRSKDSLVLFPPTLANLTCEGVPQSPRKITRPGFVFLGTSLYMGGGSLISNAMTGDYI